MTVGEAFYLFSSRFIYAPAFGRAGLLGSRYVLGAVGLMLALQLAFTYLPVMQRLFGTAAIDVAAWARIAAFGALVFALVELEKYLLRRRRGPARLLPERGRERD